jgi:outer membrane protein assembly factor BamA
LNRFKSPVFKFHALVLLATLSLAQNHSAAQQPRPTAAPATRSLSAVPPEMIGRTVEQVKIISKPRALSSAEQAQVLAQIRTHEGDKFEPTTVEGDYQRVYGLRKFSNVEARFEPTATGVIVIFEITQQNLIKEIHFKGNEHIDTQTLDSAANLKPGQAIESFRLSLAKEALQKIYQSKNFPQARVEIDMDELSKTGILVFNIVEGPRVKVRNVVIRGNKSFTDNKIKDQVKTKPSFLFFSSGVFDPDQIDADVASIRQYYESHGFFDARVGRKLVISPDQKEVQVEFVIDEGRRYVVDRITFRGNHDQRVTEDLLRKDLKMTEGRFYDADLVKRDIRAIIRAYSPYGYIYVQPEPNPDPDYLQIRDQRIFKKEPGKVELVYDIHEGKPFKLGRILVKGNSRTQDKVIEREIRVTPGQLYNSDEIQRANERLRAGGLFTGVSITPIHTNPDSEDTRDLLIEVNEARTARFMIGAAISSNSGIAGDFTYEQRNFDITNWPGSVSELFSDRAFTGAGQTLRISLQPGTELTRARIDFVDPFIFDQPYTFGASAYLSQRVRENWNEDRVGGQLSLGKRFNDVWSARLSVRGEDVQINNIQNEANRAPEIIELDGHNSITSVGIQVKRNTTNVPILPYQGTVTTAGWEHAGALGGEFNFDKVTLSFDWYKTVYEDLLERRTILAVRADSGYISGDAPFFERFYLGGIGSVRGFKYRGISPRSGIDEDPIGGDFMAAGSVELNFPLAAEVLRGVVFFDAGTVNRELEVGTIRTSVGFGFRLTLPFFGQVPIALDFGFPITKDRQDETRFFGFSLEAH